MTEVKGPVWLASCVARLEGSMEGLSALARQGRLQSYTPACTGQQASTLSAVYSQRGGVEERVAAAPAAPRRMGFCSLHHDASGPSGQCASELKHKSPLILLCRIGVPDETDKVQAIFQLIADETSRMGCN